MRILVEVNDSRSFGKSLLEFGRELVAIGIGEVLGDVEVKQLTVCISNFIRAYVDSDFTGFLSIENKVEVVLVGIGWVVHKPETPLIDVDVDVKCYTLPYASILVIISLGLSTTHLEFSAMQQHIRVVH